MIDDQVNVEELAENKKQREAAETATDDGMPVAPDSKAEGGTTIQYRTPRQWVKHARTWLGAGGAPMRPGRPVIVKRKPHLP
jgi:hypothetical protein